MEPLTIINRFTLAIWKTVFDKERVFDKKGVDNRHTKYIWQGKPPKKKTGKKVHNSCELWGGQQILVCKPQKSAFFRANFQKNMLKLIHNVPFVCLYKIQSLNSYKIMWETGVLVWHG